MLVHGRPDPIDGLFAFLVAVSIAWLLVPLTEMAARRLNVMDPPRERSLHEVATPKLGGLAILCGVLVAGVLFMPWAPTTRAILGGAVLIAAAGVLDDIFGLPASVTLLGQIVAAMIPVFNGVWVSDFTLPFVGGIRLD